MLEGSSILITGGTGSFGKAFIDHALEHLDPRRIVIFSRDELKQYEARQRFGRRPAAALVHRRHPRPASSDPRDVRGRLRRARGSAEAGRHRRVQPVRVRADQHHRARRTWSRPRSTPACKRVVALSTDKASSPLNLYGATKLAADKLFQSANHYASGYETRFSVVRYGNVMGSRGSVIPFFQKLAAEGKSLPITDARMTRFWITLPAGRPVRGRLVRPSCRAGSCTCPASRACGSSTSSRPWRPVPRPTTIGIRPGEKLHEEMISVDDARRTLRVGDRYVVLPTIARLGVHRRRRASRCRRDSRTSPTPTTSGWTRAPSAPRWTSRTRDWTVTIPYGHQSIDDGDVAAVVEALRGDWLTMGPAVGRFEEALAAVAGTAGAVAVSSGTAALHCRLCRDGAAAGRRGDRHPADLRRDRRRGGAAGRHDPVRRRPGGHRQPRSRCCGRRAHRSDAGDRRGRLRRPPRRRRRARRRSPRHPARCCSRTPRTRSARRTAAGRSAASPT